MMERVHGLVRRDLDVEVVSALGVEDGDRQAVRLRIPEQCDLETVAGSNVQLTCQLARHLCLLSPVLHGLSVPSRGCGGYAAHRRLRLRGSVLRKGEGRRGSGGLRREEEVGGLGGLGKVRVNQRVRQLPLRANYRDAVPLELVRGRSVLAKRLALQHELTKLSVQLVDIHAWSFAPAGSSGQGAGWRPVVRFSLGNQSTLVIAEAGSQCERSGTGWRRTDMEVRLSSIKERASSRSRAAGSRPRGAGRSVSRGSRAQSSGRPSVAW